MKTNSFDTLAVHAGEERGTNFGAVSTPIYTSSVYSFSDADEGTALHNDKKEGFYYGRLGNPTQAALEKAIAALEGAESALAFASGMAAISGVILSLVKTGDHIVAPNSMYSTTTAFLADLGERFGIETTFIDAAVAEEYRGAATPSTRLFWIETPSNPLLKISDIRAIAAIGRELGIPTVADNTFATPFNQRPIELGVDAVVHSATKYLGGHSDLTAGVLAGSNGVVARARSLSTKLYGGNIAPQVAWLLMRGIKTLALRMERHNENASAIANMLDAHSCVGSVFYPGLRKHAGHNIALAQMRGFGGMVAFDVGSMEAGKKLVNSVKLCTLGTSLGGVETIIQHSASLTHSILTPQQRAAAGIGEGLIRLSVGIEDAADISADLESALKTL